MIIVDTDAVTKTAGVEDIAPPSSSSSGVCIAGAMGPKGGIINGTYEATSEMSGDMPVYVKVGHDSICMVYRADVKQWQVKPSDTDGYLAYCVTPAKCLPEECPVGKWFIDVGQKEVLLPAITISLVNKDELEKYREEQK